MSSYDIIIVGASTAGSYFARRMSQRGFSVLVIEKAGRENISPEYDIFHMGTAEMSTLALPIPEPNDSVYAFQFEDTAIYSAYGNHPKPSKSPVTGMHKRAYIQRLNDWARAAGAEIIYNAAFSGLTFDASGKINGVTYTKDGEEITAGCRLCADCSGIPAVVRTTLPDSYGVETFELTPDDMFFVILKYIKFAEKQSYGDNRSDSWLFYKGWLAPAGDGADGILGAGANFGFDYAEKMLELLRQNVKLPEYEVIREEAGRTPYHRAPYSFVGDGFIAMGDAACITKPNCGEGCTASMVLADIAVEVASVAMQGGAYPTRESLWAINKRYNDSQGKEFASLLAMLSGVIKHSAKANEFFFKHDVIFSRKILGGMDGGFTFTFGDYAKTAFWLIAGIICGKIRISEVKAILNGVLSGGKLSEHYAAFPQKPSGFSEWVKKADELWNSAERMADWKLLK